LKVLVEAASSLGVDLKVLVEAASSLGVDFEIVLEVATSLGSACLKVKGRLRKCS